MNQLTKSELTPTTAAEALKQTGKAFKEYGWFVYLHESYKVFFSAMKEDDYSLGKPYFNVDLMVPIWLPYDPLPAVDAELEEAKKRFPVGSWFTDMDRGSTIFKVNDIKRVDREYKENVLVLTDCTGNWHCVDLCTPATLPTAKWRCMKTDVENTLTDRLLCLNGSYDIGWYDVAKQTWCVADNYIDLSCYETFEWLEIPRGE